jgi:hypothetical protein
MSSVLELPFHPQQIVCIDRAEQSLFAQVIQLVPERERCWAKCLAMGRWAEDRWQLLYGLRGVQLKVKVIGERQNRYGLQ